MVYLKDLKTQWPWNPQAAEDLSDKEIYTHRVSVEDASKTWRVPLLPPLNGFAFTGIRVSVYGKTSEYTMVPSLVQGATRRPMFGMPWDNTLVNNGSWGPLGFPITHKIIAIGEDGLDILIEHSDICWGRVDFVAQRFDDLLEDESDLSYVFLNHRTDKVEWILNQDNLMYKPNPVDGPLYRRRSKILPSIKRLLENQRNDWTDTAPFWNAVNLPAPLLV
jgi:hypothetical protein